MSNQFLVLKVLAAAIEEALEPHEKDKVDMWGSHEEREPHIEHEISRVFGSSHRIRIPLDSGEAHDPDVVDHLSKHGYKIKDYVNNKAEAPDGREIKIGRALSKTGASKDLIDSYSTSSEKAKNAHGDLEIVVSHHPYDVAGMTSHGHSWEGESCMNFKTGCNRRFLPAEVRNGTHVAYLVKKGDGIKHDSDSHDIEFPLARMVSKPFESDNGEETHVVFRPDKNTYGRRSDAFGHTVKRFFEEKYPLKDNHSYTLKEGSYDDSSTPARFKKISNKDVRQRLDDGRLHDLKDLSEDNITHGIDHVINTKVGHDKSLALHRLLRANMDNVTSDHVNKAYPHMDNTDVTSLPMGITNRLSGSNVKDATAGRGWMEHGSLISHSKYPQEMADQVPVHNISHLHHSKVTNNHVKRAIESFKNKETGSFYTLNDIGSGNFVNKWKPEDVSNAIEANRSDKNGQLAGITPDLMRSKAFKQEHHDSIVYNYNSPNSVTSALHYSPHDTDFKKILDVHFNSSSMMRKAFGDIDDDTGTENYGRRRLVKDNEIDDLINHHLDKASISTKRINLSHIPVHPRHLKDDTVQRLTGYNHHGDKVLEVDGMSKNNELSHDIIKRHIDNTARAYKAVDDHYGHEPEGDSSSEAHRQWSAQRDEMETHAGKMTDDLESMIGRRILHFHNTDNEEPKNSYEDFETTEAILAHADEHLPHSEWGHTSDHFKNDIHQYRRYRDAQHEHEFD